MSVMKNARPESHRDEEASESQKQYFTAAYAVLPPVLHLSLDLLPCPCTSVTADMIQNKFTQEVYPANNQLSKEAESQIDSPSGSLCVHAT